MKRLSKIFLLFIVFSVKSFSSFSWGFFAHKLINRQAVFALPKPLFNFYKYHIYAITINAVNPDKRRCMVEGEDSKHFIDLDNYSDIEKLKTSWSEVTKIINEEELLAHGIVPWHIVRMQFKLIDAFKRKDFAQIIKIPAEAAHYIADANVPLHTTKNYNGQLTNQLGIHGFWESRLPELFSQSYDLSVSKAEVISDLSSRAWKAILSAHNCVNIVLEEEKKLSTRMSSQKYNYENRGSSLQRVYSYDFSYAFHEKLQGMVEHQMKESIKMVADFWYTCWVKAGSPDLSEFLSIKNNQQDQLNEEQPIQNKQIKNFRDCC